MLRRLCPWGAQAALTLAGAVFSSPDAGAQTPSASSSAAFPTSTTPAPSQPAPSPAPPPVTVYCMPACRSGYTCVEGRCVSACNPPCGANETCTADAQCVSNAPPVAAAPAAPPAPVGDKTYVMVDPRPADPGWASAAGVYGVIAAVGTLSLAIGSEVTKDEQVPSLPLGVAATMLVGASGPIVAVGAASARHGGGVKGALGLRITGWIAYGLTLADASVLIAMGASDVEPVDGLITTVGALGAISLLSFSADAFFSAAEAEGKRGEPSPAASLVVSPTLGWSRAPDGALLPVLGARGSF